MTLQLQFDTFLLCIGNRLSCPCQTQIDLGHSFYIDLLFVLVRHHISHWCIGNRLSCPRQTQIDLEHTLYIDLSFFLVRYHTVHWNNFYTTTVQLKFDSILWNIPCSWYVYGKSHPYIARSEIANTHESVIKCSLPFIYLSLNVNTLIGIQGTRGINKGHHNVVEWNKHN